LRSGAYVGSRSITSQDRWMRSQASIARLRSVILAASGLARPNGSWVSG
jgi:hypothetical protein